MLMSTYDDFPLRKPLAYSTDYWGEPQSVGQIKRTEFVVRPFDLRVGRMVMAAFLANPEAPAEPEVDGYNFLPGNFAVGTLFRFSFEHMRIAEYSLPTDFTGIVLPANGNKKLMVAKQRKGKLKLTEAKVASNPLIVGVATESYDKHGNPTLERLHSLQIFEDGAERWQTTQDQLLASWRGKILN